MQGNNSPEVTTQDASALRVGIVSSKYYTEVNDRLLAGALEVLKKWGVVESNIFIKRVPGSFEIPYGCAFLLENEKPDAIITLGCIIKGETDHDHHIASAVTKSITELTVRYTKPISLGVITVNNLDQANVRSMGDNNKGSEAAVAAMEMALMK